ncbi:hypothetical protein [Blastococcus goldschmidtiae]|uniref:ATP-grasp domain-containing protein n=1 Tax=Blastococcus goldschmidtiae TaxID=3075546 RepID=A0ABU2KB20_9ACTN|nr:hypothetical protein [Blastococcus sp. DSM 46792]MDT0277389.1 hypothetical protein [Blastococcus sp. DSM 46792]
MGIGSPLSRVSSLGRPGSATSTLARRADIAWELGARGTRRYLDDKRKARIWAPAARRDLYADIWTEAAKGNDAGYATMGNDFTVLERGGCRIVAWFHHVQLDDAVTLKLALDKELVHRLLIEADVAVPEYVVFSPADPAAASRFLEDADRPCVLKPASGTAGGSGVTCAIDSSADLRRAVAHAARFGDLMIERSVSGREYRLLFLDGELLDVIGRRPPHVVGDGRSSVAELVSQANAQRAADAPRSGIAYLDTDLDCLLTLDMAGLSLRSVLPAGVTVQLKSAANRNGPGDNETIDRDQVSDALIAEARRAVVATGLRFAGVDLITPDLSRPLSEAGGAVIEVNGTPGLHYHYLVADPDRATPVAVPLLRTLLEEADLRERRMPRISRTDG